VDLRKMNHVARFMLLQVLRGYKWLLSPLLPPSCRYVPTCSEYAVEAIERYGIVRGALLSTWRLLRCHPFAAGGYDPVVKLHDCRKSGGAKPATQSLNG
jgi:putative membrane protein insertion efficiency factor